MLPSPPTRRFAGERSAETRTFLHSPLQVIPFPVAQVSGTLVKKLQRPAGIVVGSLPVGEGDAVKIRIDPL
jgi:hypothetical protein